MSTQFHPLKIIALSKPIKAATTITFEVPEELYDSFSYYPGQHLVIKFRINGEEARRSYSLNSSPYFDNSLQVTVKKIKDGLVSNYVNDKLEVGTVLDVMLPQGRFYADVQKDDYKSYFLFAAGSGITPIFSILKSILHASPKSKVCLLYGNTNQDTIIFREELAALEDKFPERLKVIHTLSNAKVWMSWEQWKGRKGRIDTESIEWFITENPPIAQSTEYYICGPGKMNTSVKQTLMELGIPKDLIHIEQFGGVVEEGLKEIDAVDQARLTTKLNGQKINVTIPKGKTILAVLKESNSKPPYSCESGICGTCVAKLKKGTAEMKSCMALEDKEIEQGLILTCQALPTSENIEIVFE